MSAEYLQSLFGLDGQVAVVIGGTGVLGGALASHAGPELEARWLPPAVRECLVSPAGEGGDASP